MAAYRLPKPDGTYITGVTVRDGYVYGPSGKKLGKTKMFPDLETADGQRVSQPTVAPLGDDSGQALDDVTPQEPQTPETPVPDGEADAEASEEPGSTRVGPNGIEQKGMTLGGIKSFLEFNPELKIADGADYFDFSGVEKAKATKKMKDAYSSTDAPAFAEGLTYELPTSAWPTTPPGTISVPQGKAYQQAPKGWSMPEGSMPGTLGKMWQDPQEGVSDKPDIADTSRAIGFNNPKRGERAGNFRNRPGNRAFGGEEPSDSSLVSPMYRDKGRNAYRSGFLDSTAKGPMGVLRDAAASQGVIRTNDGKISIRDGDAYRTYTGDKSAREVAYDLGGGQSGFDKHAADFEKLTPPDKPEVQADDEQTPATIQPAWKDMTMEQKEGAVTAYAQDFVNTFKDKLKDKK